MSRAENGLATRPIVTVEEILLNDSLLLPSFKDEGFKLMACFYSAKTANRKPSTNSRQ
jgi:hypothetical protein|tara:strand:- start:221 stop:394 length:174 start_codon:yes stop_codon:yes gene_type:complete